MIDFLRSNAWCSQEEYKWGMTVPQIRLAGLDFSHCDYTSEGNNKKDITENKNVTVIRNAEDLDNLNEFGVPVI